MVCSLVVVWVFICFGIYGDGIFGQLKALADVIAISGVVKDIRGVRLDVFSCYASVELFFCVPRLTDPSYAFVARCTNIHNSPPSP